jgi:hypothetical protein
VVATEVGNVAVRCGPAAGAAVVGGARPAGATDVVESVDRWMPPLVAVLTGPPDTGCPLLGMVEAAVATGAVGDVVDTIVVVVVGGGLGSQMGPGVVGPRGWASLGLAAPGSSQRHPWTTEELTWFSAGPVSA